MLMAGMLSIRGRGDGSRAAVSLALALCGAMLSACSGGDDSPEPAPTSSAAGGLTAPGTSLGIDDAATVDFTAGAKRQSKVKVTVTRVQHGSVKDLGDFDLDNAARQSGVYYVRAAVRNVGHGDLGGSFVKLYAKVSDTLVVQPVIFGSTFGKCDYKPLPKPFGRGKRADLCMVMLAPRHGAISAVEWRFGGDQVDQEPISWELP
jgi:hypothetical protein